ncbi:MAG TPA: trypsin-like peptidase domain-containing protein [Tepidisphaeraceae bacterium]|jgi:S1-C subfamily serine protease
MLFPRRGRCLAVTLSVLSLPFIPLISCHAGHQQAAVAAVDSAYIENADTLELTGLQRKFEAVADKVAKQVVAISAACDASISDDAMRGDDLTPQRLDNILSKTTRTVGTGLFIDADGFILTNEHVIADCEQLWVTTDDRKVYPAIVIGSDPRADLAVLKIPKENVPAVKFAVGSTVRRGDWTIALGNPYGLASEGSMAMSVGVVSALERSLPKLSSKEGRLYSNLIQTTAQINPGNSGGPLFNINGEVIGISTAVILPQKSTNGIGFALPITNELLAEVEALKQGREVMYGYVGLTVGEPTARELRQAGLGGNRSAARIDAIEPKSPAAGVGLRMGDLVVSINGQPLRNADHFVRVVGRMPIAESGKIGVWRSGREVELAVTPCKRDMPSLAVNKWSQRLRWHGMTLSSVPANWSGKAGDAALTGVYVVGIDDPATCSKWGVKQGTIIRSVAGKMIKSMSDLQKVIDSTPPDQIRIETADAQTVASVEPGK